MDEPVLSVKHLTVDCADPAGLARWWARLLGWELTEETDGYAVIAGEDSVSIGFVRVAEPKSVKNRLHLDLAVRGDWERAVARAVRAGATELSRHREYGTRWAVLADPEGNEFCV